uniref:Uncharacterized protein n=1 Tax=Arundo donax TaxID=35708 RepID=A0A0A9FEX2_ARUDO
MPIEDQICLMLMLCYVKNHHFLIHLHMFPNWLG